MGGIFRSSPKDGLLVLCSLMHIGLFWWIASNYDRYTFVELFALAIVCLALNFVNTHATAHYFSHLPFFRSKRANNAFAALNSLTIAAPQTLFSIFHLNHHRYNNDSLDVESMTTKDWSSIFRHSKVRGEPESLITYSLFGPFRTDIAELFRVSKKKNRHKQALFEGFIMLGFYGALAFINPLAFGLFFLPVLYFGQAFGHLESYVEHLHSTDFDDKNRDSVSCYSRVYNFLTFNNGYHQEHHVYPQKHWSKLPPIRSELPDESSRRVVPFCHLTNLFLSRESSPLEISD